jgi:hypothetical protein
VKFRAQYPCRCSRKACQQRRTLPRHPNTYIRPPRCRGCGGRSFRVDKFRKRVENKRYACDCNGYGFRHKIKSKWCIYAPAQPTPDEIEHRYGSRYRESDRCPF